MAGANSLAFGPLARYSSQAEESTTFAAALALDTVGVARDARIDPGCQAAQRLHRPDWDQCDTALIDYDFDF